MATTTSTARPIRFPKADPARPRCRCCGATLTPAGRCRLCPIRVTLSPAGWALVAAGR